MAALRLTARKRLHPRRSKPHQTSRRRKRPRRLEPWGTARIEAL